MSSDEFPQPAPEAIRHSEQLIAAIREAISAAGGWLSFENYMDMALYAPGLGYYAAGAHKLGEAGDFITAPEVSSLFGRVLARQFAEVLEELGSGDILELGAGSGRLAVDVLGELKAMDRLPQRYLILEVSPDLRERQRSLLNEEHPDIADRIQWLDEPPAELSGVVFGNEVLDALPVARFRLDEAGIQEEGVVWDGERFTSSFRLADEDFAARLRNALADVNEPLPTPYTSEFSRRVPALIATLADSLQAGLMLFIDYGYGRREYYLGERSMGTLMCHYRHRAHPDPYAWPGLQDITAYVDFTQVVEAGIEQGLELMAYTTQAQFLLAGGLEKLMAGDDAGSVDYMKRAQEVQRLTLPGEMGDRFKVVGLCRNIDRVVSGFGLRDLSGSL